jgi:hypothetical protein
MPVLILTARDGWHEKVAGIDAGADDYLTKPFHMEELLARLRALIRRSGGHASAELVCGPLTLDTRNSRATVGGHALTLTSHEYRVLAYLMHHRDEVISRSDLVEHIYAQDFDRDSNTVEVFIARLRKKLPPGLIRNRAWPRLSPERRGVSVSLPRSPLAARGSLRIRLLAGTLFWIAASIAVAAWGLSSLFREHVATQFHAELKTHLNQLTAHLALDPEGQAMLAMPLSDPRLSLPYSGLYWQVDALPSEGESAQAGAALVGQLRSRSLWDGVLAVPPDAPADGEIHQHRVAGPGRRLAGHGRARRAHRRGERRAADVAGAADGLKPTLRAFRLIVAADERLMLEPVSRFNGALWLALGILAAGLVVAALVQVFVGLAPLRKLRAALGRVRDGDAQRLEGQFPPKSRRWSTSSIPSWRRTPRSSSARARRRATSRMR